MGRNLYERRKARAKQPVPPATYRQLEKLVITRAARFCEEYMQTDGWSRDCERKAMLLNMAIEHLLSKRSQQPPESEPTETRAPHYDTAANFARSCTVTGPLDRECSYCFGEGAVAMSNGYERAICSLCGGSGRVIESEPAETRGSSDADG